MNKRLPAVIAFGDSLVDPGNNDWIPTIGKANFSPYGRDFINQEPTGRFSNGKIATDLIVSQLGLKELLPAYLDPKLKPDDLLTGVSFGSGGTGFDLLTAKQLAVLSIWDQLEWFKEYIEKLKTIAGEEGAKYIISNSLYIICAGNNDILITYPLSRKQEYDTPSYAGFLVQTASNFTEELYKLGARKFAVIGVPPLGCVPLQRFLLGGIERKCVASTNEEAIMFNTKLAIEAVELGTKFLNMKISYIDVFTPSSYIVQHPSQFGFEEVSKACCGTGTVEASIVCNKLEDKLTCKDASKYVFWDSFHPTQRTYEFLVPGIVKELLHLT